MTKILFNTRWGWEYRLGLASPQDTYIYLMEAHDWKLVQLFYLI